MKFTENIGLPVIYAVAIWPVMHQSIPPAPRPPGLTPGNWHFFALDGKFTGVGTLELANPPGWGRKKRANAPSSVNSATFFIDRTVQ